MSNAHARPVFAATLSQAFSASSNFVIILALGRLAGAREVGGYALAFGAYNAFLGLQRASLTDALIARRVGSTASPTDERRLAVTVSLGIGTGAAMLLAVAGMLTPYGQLAIIAPFLVGVLVEDVCRYLMFRIGRHTAAAALDAVWFAISCSAFVVLRGHPHSTTAIVIWGSGGTFAAVLGLVLLKSTPVHPRRARLWWSRNLGRSSRWLTLEAVGFHADQQIAAFGLTIVAGATLFGEYQIAGSLVGLSMFVTTGIAIVAASHFTNNDGDQARVAAIVAAVSFATVVVVTLVLVAASDVVLPALYGHRVTISISVIVATGAIYAMAATAGGAHALLRARQSEAILPAARAIAVVACAPPAIAVAARNFPLGLWVLALEGAVYSLIVCRAAFRNEVQVHQEALAA